MLTFFVVLEIVGVVLLLLGFAMNTRTDLDFGVVVVGVVMLVAGFVGSMITASINSDKNYCLKTLPQVSSTETKWLDGECYMKANDGKFVPKTWIEKGYNDK